MNVMIRDKGIKLAAAVTRKRRFHEIALFLLLLIILVITAVRLITHIQVGTSERTLSPKAVNLSPISPATTQFPVLSPSFAAQGESVIDVSPKEANLVPFISTIYSLGGISLYDDAQTVEVKKGNPTAMVQDPQFIGAITYEYPDLNIGFDNNNVSFVQVPAEAGHIQINDQSVSLTVSEIRGLLGEPDYVAEDGLVFQRKEALIKLFLDPETQELISLNYYHLSST
ncbi:hypothetical protein [Paenibacillus sp. N3.4]|uniref:hypothetical protein n=1 Tax=Paenibacillus sp. N3.4 TaxID=2603222 RepID=UPI0011C7B659|nr:hypothetical protein [Paenibacillus sp. N3.4]TXK74844.1 hypothetical protein FU659_28145 [Paenibacillus sp. N3.4]